MENILSIFLDEYAEATQLRVLSSILRKFRISHLIGCH